MSVSDSKSYRDLPPSLQRGWVMEYIYKYRGWVGVRKIKSHAMQFYFDMAFVNQGVGLSN